MSSGEGGRCANLQTPKADERWARRGPRSRFRSMGVGMRGVLGERCLTGELLAERLVAEAHVDGGVALHQVLKGLEAMGGLLDVLRECAGLDAVLPAPRRVAGVT